jgi:hypothetical protein
MEGWEPVHSGALSNKTYYFKLKIDRFTHIFYSATEGNSHYTIKLSMEKHSNTTRLRKILEYYDNNSVVMKEI